MTSSRGGAGEKDDEILNLDSSLVPFLKDPHYQALIRVVEANTAGFFLTESKHDRRHMAKQLTELLDSLPKDLVADDLITAVQDKDFDGLRGMSWGLLLSPSYSDRFKEAIKRAVLNRKSHAGDEKATQLKILRLLNSLDPGDRSKAIDHMASHFKHEALAKMIKRTIEKDSVLDNRLAALRIIHTCNGNLASADRRGLAVVCKNQLPVSDGEFKTELEYAISELEE